MPVPGIGGYVLRNQRNQEPQPPPKISGEFIRVQISTSNDKISGNLFLNYDTIRYYYDGIKIRLNLHLKPIVADRSSATSSDMDLFDNCPIEAILPGGVFQGQKRLKFTLDIPHNRICPTPFISSNGSLTYRLVALIKRSNTTSWYTVANKLLLDFKGYHNINVMDFNPSVDFKQFFDGKITSILTLNKPVLLIGRDTNLSATLEVEGVLHYNVDVTVTLLRKAKCLENVKTEIISLQKQQADFHEDYALFKWNFDVPNISRVTYVNELTSVYSVQYFVKYEATFKPIKDENGICVDGNGIVEVKVGTTSGSGGCSSSMITNRVENITLVGRRSSVTSIQSMITLPPPYSQLSSRSTSVMSLETQPPDYNDLY